MGETAGEYWFYVCVHQTIVLVMCVKKKAKNGRAEDDRREQVCHGFQPHLVRNSSWRLLRREEEKRRQRWRREMQTHTQT